MPRPAGLIVIAARYSGILFLVDRIGGKVDIVPPLSGIEDVGLITTIPIAKLGLTRNWLTGASPLPVGTLDHSLKYK